MYNEFLNNDVTVFVSPRTEQFLEYKGFLESENEDTITLRNASIKFAMVNFQKNMFGGGISTMAENIERIIINKKYIMSCYK